MSLAAFGLNCTLKSGPQESSTQKLLDQVLRALAGHGVTTSSGRAVDHDIKPGVAADEGEGDAWPPIRQRIMDSQSWCSPRRSGWDSRIRHRELDGLTTLSRRVVSDTG